jgi:hypothetical protein
MFDWPAINTTLTGVCDHTLGTKVKLTAKTEIHRGEGKKNLIAEARIFPMHRTPRELPLNVKPSTIPA